MTPHLAAAARRAPLLRPAGTCGATPERSTAPSALGGSAPTGGGGTCLPPRRRCEWFVPPLPLSLPAAGGGAFPSWRSMRNCSSGAERLGAAAEQVSGRGGRGAPERGRLRALVRSGRADGPSASSGASPRPALCRRSAAPRPAGRCGDARRTASPSAGRRGAGHGCRLWLREEGARPPVAVRGRAARRGGVLAGGSPGPRAVLLWGGQCGERGPERSGERGVPCGGVTGTALSLVGLRTAEPLVSRDNRIGNPRTLGNLLRNYA